MTSKSCLLLCVVVFVSSVLVTSEALPATHNLLRRLQKRSGIRLCGRMLVDTLATICHSEYYAPEFHKRNYAYDSEHSSWDSNSEETVPSEESQNSLDYLWMNQPSRRGVADECCIKSCSVSMLFSYCGSYPGK